MMYPLTCTWLCRPKASIIIIIIIKYRKREMFRGRKVSRFSRMVIQSRNFYAGYWRYLSTSNVLIQHRETFPLVYENVCHARNFSTAEHLPFTVLLYSTVACLSSLKHHCLTLNLSGSGIICSSGKGKLYTVNSLSKLKN